jgi:hypothetical protein
MAALLPPAPEQATGWAGAAHVRAAVPGSGVGCGVACRLRGGPVGRGPAGGRRAPVAAVSVVCARLEAAGGGAGVCRTLPRRTETAYTRRGCITREPVPGPGARLERCVEASLDTDCVEASPGTDTGSLSLRLPVRDRSAGSPTLPTLQPFVGYTVAVGKSN